MWIYYSKFRKLYNSQFFDKNLSSGRSLKYWNKILKACFLEKAFCLKFSFEKTNKLFRYGLGECVYQISGLYSFLFGQEL